MSREIKFRAWDNIFNAMLSDVVVWDSDNECIAILDQPAQWVYGDKLDERMELNFEGSVPEWYCFTGGFNIMQYTGLKDKNGIEIYEGDIVNVNHPVYDPDSSIDSVNFIDGCWRLTSNNKSDIPLFNYKPQSIEVIGNIYQNKELLT